SDEGHVHQGRGNGDRDGDPLDPALELVAGPAVGQAIHNDTHDHICEGIKNACHQEENTDVAWVDTHHIGVEDHEEGGLENEGEIITEITEHITEVVTGAKWRNVTFEGRGCLRGGGGVHGRLQLTEGEQGGLK